MNFERIKKKNIGLFINLFNGPESIANLFSRYYFEGIIALDLIDEIAKITLDVFNVCLNYLTVNILVVCN